MHEKIPEEILAGLKAGSVIPYLGPGMLTMIAGGSPVPASPEALAAVLTSKVSVPHKIRTRLTAAAQFIENFKHRKTLVTHMNAAFVQPIQPSPLHRYFASLPLPLLVETWYDSALSAAMASRSDWGCVQGLAQSEHFGDWNGYYDASGQARPAASAATWTSLLYQPMGSATPAANYLVSDSDYVEVFTEIDIQTPIPARVQELRSGRHFLFVGCRFDDQLKRTFARQIMKRSSDRHWALLTGELTRNEERFLQEQHIQRLDLSLEAFTEQLTGQALAVA